jgi:hypothetical protein
MYHIYGGNVVLVVEVLVVEVVDVEVVDVDVEVVDVVVVVVAPSQLAKHSDSVSYGPPTTL